MSHKTLSVASYQVGILCALFFEAAAMAAALEEEHESPQDLPTFDDNSYIFGRIGKHNVVIACLPDGKMGTVSAATVGNSICNSFRQLKVGLMVGIGGGVPSYPDKDIRLGDIVVSRPDGNHGGVIQWDFGKWEASGFRHTGTLNKPPKELLAALATLRREHERPSRRQTSEYLLQIINEMGHEYEYPGQDNDVLFETSHSHKTGPDTPCSKACDSIQPIYRTPRNLPKTPNIHYGNIASGNSVMRDGPQRDHIAQLATGQGILCFDMEAAGLEDSFPCIVVRGICDYSDSHKSKSWQRYAAAAAAAFAKEFLGFVRPKGLEELRPITEEPKSYVVPFEIKSVPRIEEYVARDHEIDQLKSFFFPQNPSEVRQRIFAIRGMGGVGKTQLCIEFFSQHQPQVAINRGEHAKGQFTSIFWLDGSSKNSIEQSLAKYARAVCGMEKKRAVDMEESDQPGAKANVKALAEQFLCWLSEPQNNKWLLVIDNLDRPWPGKNDPLAYDIKAFLPAADHGNILITTRLAMLQLPGIPLGGVDDKQAQQMLESRAKRILSGAKPLLERLGGLPLALVQAGSYIGRTGISVSKYLESYDREDKWTMLMQSQERYPLQEYNQRSVLTT